MGHRADVWLVDLEAASGLEAPLRALLDAEECARADRFHFAEGRRDFTITRGVLRVLLGARLGREPAAVRFGTLDEGKPVLDAPLGGLEFNVSHTRSRALIGLTDGPPIGVDVEAVDRRIELLDLARRNFAPHEVDALLRLPPAEQPSLFFRIWAAREACLKARGLGIAHLGRLALAVRCDGALRLDRFEGDSVAASRWTLRLPDLGPAYGCAVAVPVPDCEVRLREWTPGLLTDGG